MAVLETLRRREKRSIAIDLLGAECVNCGSTDNLEFDHINRDRKDDRHLLSQLWGSSWQRIEQELEKCQLLCKDCHWFKTATELNKSPIALHGTNARYGGKHKCRCDLCKEAHIEHNRKYPHYRKGAQ